MANLTESHIKLLAGLGNPGVEYENTRHNAGFKAIDSLLSILPGRFEPYEEHGGCCWKGNCNGRRIYILKPMKFMNLSGQAVASMMRRNRLEVSELLVIYDDVDLPLGKIRVKKNGSSAGHRGIESVINEIGTSDFARIRIGIGRNVGNRQIEHVLSQFTEAEQSVYQKVIKLAAGAAVFAMRRGVEEAMNEYNGQFINTDNIE